MSYKKDELLNRLTAALEQIESSLNRAYDLKTETLDLSPALANTEKAKKVASPRDKALVEDFEREIKKFIGVRMTPQNVAKMKEILQHFGSEVSMAMAVQDYSDDDYSAFLKLLEKPGIKDHIINLQEGRRKPIGREEAEMMFNLKIIEEKNGKIQLTERGRYLAKALKPL